MKRKQLLAFVLLLAVCGAAAKPKTTAYLFTYFTGNAPGP